MSESSTGEDSAEDNDDMDEDDVTSQEEDEGEASEHSQNGSNLEEDSDIDKMTTLKDAIQWSVDRLKATGRITPKPLSQEAFSKHITKKGALVLFKFNGSPSEPGFGWPEEFTVSSRMNLNIAK
jgi:hypothetical protein